MRSILKQIIKIKKQEVAEKKQKFSLAQIKNKAFGFEREVRDFEAAVKGKKTIALIGELKIASPSKGMLNSKLDLVKSAQLYERNGVSAISVLTDKHFKGRLSDLKKVRQAVKVPVLRKDFMVDEYQIYESFLAGADAVLLIAAVLGEKKISAMLDIVHLLGMNAIVEVHDPEELKKIDFCKTRIIGINNRNLDTFELSLDTTVKVSPLVPSTMTLISESGIFSREDVLFLKKSAIDAVLVGEGIVTSKNIAVQIRKLLGKK